MPTKIRPIAFLLCGTTLLAVPASAHASGRDDAFGSGTVTYRRWTGTDASTTIQGALTWSRDGRYRHDVKARTPDGGVLERSFVFHPRWKYIETKVGKSAEVSFSDAEVWPLDDDARFFIVAGPSRPLAARLGDADLKLLDVGPDGIPKHVERLLQGRVVNRWEFSGRLNGGAVVVPQTARYEVPGHPEHNRTFTIVSAKIGTAPSEGSLATEWFAPGKTIVDRRVSPNVTWSYEELRQATQGRRPTPESLLLLSRKKSRELVPTPAKSSVTSQRRKQGQRAGMAMALVGVLGMVGASSVRRRE
jgi:hypothetical protein